MENSEMNCEEWKFIIRFVVTAVVSKKFAMVLVGVVKHRILLQNSLKGNSF
jgi:hypothetical protein